MIPTTAGTGAEATPNAIVAVPEKELKVGIVNDNMIADYVILDAVMIKELPRKLRHPPVWTPCATRLSALPQIKRTRSVIFLLCRHSK